ncbi:MAG: hypothetical protein HQK55_05320 [Deltaproteobacteria bacterium]|nr:hypothetical protein [Deltaproteobacteria bacterium]
MLPIIKKCISIVMSLAALLFLTQCDQMKGFKIPGLSSLTGAVQRTPISTSLEDAVTEIPSLDGFKPLQTVSLASQPRDTASGGFRLERSGFYSMVAQSYCLHAGTYAPGGGDGYIYAPLKGSRAEIVRNILQRSVNYPAIDQHEIQILIWAIISKTKISSMDVSMISNASKLLTPTELAMLNDVYIEEAAGKLAQSSLPPEVFRIMEAESQVRGLLSTGQAAYANIERVAVLAGAAPWGLGSRKTPEGRWSYHPDGYFVRYFPSNYSRTAIDAYVPECLRIERDNQGRVILIEDQQGNRIQIQYTGTDTPVPGDGNIKACAFGSVKISTRTGRGFSQDGRGWTLVGWPSGNGKPETSPFADLPQRYQWAENFVTTHKFLATGSGSAGNPIDLAHLDYALKALGASQVTDLATRAFLYEICLRQGKCRPGCGSAGGQVVVFDPTWSVATPGNTSRQRLATSARVYRGN